MKARDITLLALLCALALVLGYVESLLPIAPGLPGIKAGLSNTVLLYAVALLDYKRAGLLMLMKVFLSALLFAGAASIPFSLCGGALSLVVMVGLRKFPKLDIVFVSIGGALAHNIGQVIVACFVIYYKAALAYLPVLLITGALAGTLTGVIARILLHTLKRRG